ncbi:MAG: type I-MYXAN CRISPR-associated Cas8a1/Cmx1 [Cyanobacteria bacterium P01_A01_bin.83]
MIIASKPKISLDLNASDITEIHRDGMLGLWMSLKQLEKKYPKSNQRLGNLTWDLTSTTITLDWQGQDFTVIDWLLKQCFQINEKGLIQFIGLEPSSLIKQIHNHQVIHDTFLRHNKFYKKETVRTETLTVEAGSIKLKYRGLNWYAHQTFAETLCDEEGYLINGYIPIVSWLYPSATVRHAKLQAVTKIEEKTKYAFTLLFLPLICQYFTVLSNSTKRDRKQAARYAIVIPDVSDFEIAANRCWQSGDHQYQGCFVNNLGEAALNYYSFSQKEIISPQSCQVLLYEKLNKKSRQRILLEIEDFAITPQAINDYQFVSRNFIDNKIFVYDNQSFTVKVNSIRAIVANNLAQKLPWWWDLWERLYQTEPLESEDLDKQLVFNRRGLLAMLEQDTKLQIYQDFIRAFHEALRKIYAKTYDKKRSRAENNQRIDKKYQAIRSELSQCYDQESLEDFLADFLSRAGLNASLYNRWEQILPLIVDEANWKKTRNLSLIALASYKPRGFSLQTIPIVFWKTLLDLNFQAAILFLLQQPLLEIISETQEAAEVNSEV